MSGYVTDPEQLEACVGRLPGPRDLKVIDHLDRHAIDWIAASPCAFAVFGDAAGLAVTAAGGAAGFARAEGERRLAWPAEALDDPTLAREGAGVGTLFLVPGLGETLRVNGRVGAVAGGRIAIEVEECYLHCAKALIRSGFWAASPAGEAPPADPAARLEASRFLALGTLDASGRADLSPKGDPAGALLRLRDGAAWFPDRPGNRRVDSFRNILAQPRVAALALVPGSHDVVHLAGIARLCADADACAPFAVDGKTPKLATRLDEPRLRAFASPALARARLWPLRPTTARLDPAEIFRAHVGLSRERGLQAGMARAATAVPGLLRRSLDRDYKKNLY